METTKRRCSVLIPYKRHKGDFLVFLQKRSKNAKKAPNMFGFWGGGAISEQEKPEDVLIREIKEELNFIPFNYWRLGYYDFPEKEMFVYCQEVGDDFETKIEILEGDYGKWFSKDEVFSEPNLIKNDKPVLRDFFQKMGR